MLDRPSWEWGLLLSVLTMAMHAGAVVMMACVSTSIRFRLEPRSLNLLRVMLILICLIGIVGLLLVVLHGIESGIWAAAYLWLGALNSPLERLTLFRRFDDHARRIRADAAITLADVGRSGGS